MIERQTLGGRDASVGYFSAAYEPTDKDTAELVRVIFDDGETLMLKPPKRDGKKSHGTSDAVMLPRVISKYSEDEPRDDSGKWTDGGGDGSGDGGDDGWPTGGHPDKLPRVSAGDTVDGLTVLEKIPNTDSIGSSMEDHESHGLREVHFSLFQGAGNPVRNERTKNLAEQIKQSGEIAPLIVAFEEHNKAAGPYIVEGSHRFDALQILGKKSFPALVVTDTSERDKAMTKKIKQSMQDLADEAPDPDGDESQEDFISRCQDELSDTYQDQLDSGEFEDDDIEAACEIAWENSSTSASYTEYADPGYRADSKKRYPLDDAKQIRRAWFRIHRDVDEYTAAQLSRITTRIKNAWVGKIGKDGPPLEPDMIELLRAPPRAAPTVLYKTHSTEGTGMEFVLSDATPDRFGDIVEPAGWQLDNFKKNPIALFGHDSSFPIGRWEGIAVGKSDLRARLALAPKGTSDRIDEIRNLIDADVLRATSVGFRPLAAEPLDKDDRFGAKRFTRHELVECSVVAVPANPNALAVAKSLGVSTATLRTVFGEHADKSSVQRRDFSVPGKHADDKGSGGGKEVVPLASMPKPSEQQGGKPMLLSKRIQDAEKHVLALQDSLDKHIETIDDQNPTDEQMVLTEDLTAKIETAQRHLTNLKAIEAKSATTAVDASSPDHQRRAAATARAPLGITFKEKKIEPLDLLFRAARVRCMAKTENADIDVIRHKIYGDDELTRVACDLMLKAASAPAETTVAGWAAELVRTIWSAWMEALLPQSVFPKLSAAGLALTFGANGRIIIPTRSLTPSVSGSFVGEGQPIPVRQGAFTSQTLTPKKMAVISTFTKEMQDYSQPAIEGLLRQMMLDDTAISLDTVLLSSNPATAIAPAGLRSYQAGLTASAATPGFVNFVADYKALFGSLIGLTNGNVRSPVMILNPAQTLSISLMQPPAAAAPLFPFISMVDGGRVLRAGLIESATVPPGQVTMVDAADFTTAGEEGVRLEISDAATLHMEDTAPADIVSGPSGTEVIATPVKSMWQTDSLALRLIMRINFVMRRPVVSWMSGVAW